MTLAVYALADSPVADTPLDVGVTDPLAVVDSVLKPATNYAVTGVDVLVVVAVAINVQLFHGSVVMDVLVVTDSRSAQGAMAAREVEALTIAEADQAFFLWFATMPEVLNAQDTSVDNMVKGAWQDSDQTGNLWGLDTTPGRP